MTAKATIIRESVTVTPNTRFVLPALAGPVPLPACRLVLILDAELGLADEIVLKGVADTDGAAVMAGDEAAPMLGSSISLSIIRETDVEYVPVGCARAVVAAAGVEGTNADEMLLKEEIAAAELLS